MKVKFKRIHLFKLRVGELYPFMLILHEALLQSYPNLNEKLKRQCDELGQLLEVLNKAMEAGGYQTESKTVKNADKKRDNRLIAFRLLVESASYSDNPTIGELANIVLNALNDAGKSITALSLKEETSAIHALNELFTTNSRYTDALAGLKLKESWGEVWTAQQNFEGYYSYRTDVMATEKMDATAYELSKTASTTCYYIMELVEDLYHIEEKPEYLTIIDKMNIEIEKTMAAVHTRETLAAKAREEEKNKDAVD